MKTRTLILCSAYLLCALGAHASTYTVTHNGDAPDANHGDDVCATASCVCTLRAAIEEANNHSGADVIVPGSGAPYVLTPATVLPDASGPLLIDGLGCGTCGATFGFEIEGNNELPRALLINGAVTVRGVKIRGVLDTPSSAVLMGGTGPTLACADIEAEASVLVNVTTDTTSARVLNSRVAWGSLASPGDCIQAHSGSTDILVQGNTVVGCDDGIYFAGATGYVFNNHVSECPHNGIHLDAGSHGVGVRGNVSEGNGYDGLRINASNGVIVGGPLSVDRNVFADNDRDGVSIESATGTRVERNDLGGVAGCNEDLSINDNGAGTVMIDNDVCDVPLPGCCTVSGGGVTCLDADVIGEITAQADCQTALDDYFEPDGPVATSFNPLERCEAVAEPGTGTCPAPLCSE